MPYLTLHTISNTIFVLFNSAAEMDDEKLIECVRQCPALYDVSHPKYLDNTYKIQVWEGIGKKMNTSGKQRRLTIPLRRFE